MGVVVISRKPGQRIFVGNICVKASYDKVHRQIRIAILAPPEVQIHREELLDRDDPRLQMLPDSTRSNAPSS